MKEVNMDNLRTFETARLLRVNRCELFKMTDEQLKSEIAIYTRPPKPMATCRAKNSTYNGAKSINISKTWKTASQMDKGLAPKGLGINSGGGFIR